MKRYFLCLILFLLPWANADALPSCEEVRKSYVKSDSLLLDRNGEVLHELRTDHGRRRLEWTPLQSISPALREAVIEAEDRRFHEHRGVDYRAIGAAIIQGLTSESLRGASTITMQLASLLDRELQTGKRRRSIWQKKKQILEAWEIEKSWTKGEMLEVYLNLITYRGELQGIAAASRGLFGKAPHGLDHLESLILASLIRSPNASLKEVTRRASQLNQMMKWQVEEREIESKVREIFLGSNSLRPQVALAPHIARSLLRHRPRESSVRCTLESQIQRFASDRLTHHLSSLKSQNVKDGAILVVENKTGDVLAYVSHSGDPFYSRFVDGVQAKRQAGSALKPFLYALAFEKRILTLASLLNDTPLDLAVSSGIYQPKNYDSQFKGLVTTRIALASSLNIPAVQVLSLVGEEAFIRKLREMGVRGLHESGEFYGPSLALGSADVSLWELVNAYRTLANEGVWSDLVLIPGEGRTHKRREVFSKEAAFLVSDILSDREARSPTFGLENPLTTRFWTAVKTGTSKEMRDNWCIGYSDKFTVGLWVGNFSGEPMWNITGISGAAPVWNEIMNFLHRKEGSPRRNIPTNVLRTEVEFLETLGSRKREWFIRGTEPNLKEQRAGQFNHRILYPPSGTVIALDPDIPKELQKIFFVFPGNEKGLQWTLNEEKLRETGRVIAWIPKGGKYSLWIADREGRVLDGVYFEVRGP